MPPKLKGYNPDSLNHPNSHNHGIKQPMKQLRSSSKTLLTSLKTLNDNKELPHVKLQEPDTFTRQDSQKLQTFLMQCHFQFRD
jgi:hypothetical protein